MKENAAPPITKPAAGWKKLGSGLDKAAYLAPDGSHVVLVADGISAGTTLIDWVASSRRINSPHMPVFLSEVLVNKKARRYMVKMERLKPITNAGLIEVLDWLDSGSKSFTHIAPSATGLRSLLAQLERNRSYKVSDDTRALLENLQKMQPRFLSDWVDLCILSKRKNHVLDLHAENIMLRTSGAPTLVITDPW